MDIPAHVASGRIFCPLSGAAFLELMKQPVPESFRETLRLVDQLSAGVAICDERERMHMGIQNLLEATAAPPPGLRDKVCVRLTHVLGGFYPSKTALSPEEELVIQKAFTDHLRNLPLSDLELENRTMLPLEHEQAAARLTELNTTHAHQVGTFHQTYLAEIGGTLELFAGFATDIFERKMLRSGADPKELPAGRRSEREQMARTVLYNVARVGKAVNAFPSLHLHAKCHAAFRRDKRRPVKGNDLIDFHHALAAVVYCDAFFTENPLHTFLTTNPAAANHDFNCRVIADEELALEFLRSL